MQKPALRDGKIVRSEDPLNLEVPFATLDSFITPTKSFYVRSHFPIPKIDRNKWRLRVEGEVERPFEINYGQLIKLESEKIPVTLECAGNNRNFLEPKVKGVQWGLGAVGNAAWTGVPLPILLDRAKVKPTAREVILEGADRGKLEDPKSPAGDLNFARSIPLEKANDVLLAYKMNDVDLPPEHGFPLRAIVPGWYAMASIKWLQRIIVTDRPFNGYYQTLDYAFWERRGGNAELVALSEMQIKAEIAEPRKAKPFRQVQTCAFMVRPGRVMAKLRKSSSAPTAVRLGTKQNYSTNRNRTRGGFGNLIGRHPRNRESRR